MALEALPPDGDDIAEVMAPSLASCPFCGGRPVTHQAVNRTPTFGSVPIYRSIINCTGRGCGASLGHNAVDLQEARRVVAERWNRRTRPEDVEAPVFASPPPLARLSSQDD